MKKKRISRAIFIAGYIIGLSTMTAVVFTKGDRTSYVFYLQLFLMAVLACTFIYHLGFLKSVFGFRVLSEDMFTLFLFFFLTLFMILALMLFLNMLAHLNLGLAAVLGLFIAGIFNILRSLINDRIRKKMVKGG